MVPPKYLFILLASCFGAGIFVSGFLPLHAWVAPLLYALMFLPLTGVVLSYWLGHDGHVQRRWFSVCFLVAIMQLGMVMGFLQRQRETTEWPSGSVNYSATILSAPKVGDKSISFRARIPSGPMVMLWLPRTDQVQQLKMGQSLRFVSRIRQPYNFGDSPSFDYAAYLRHSGISGMGYARVWSPCRLDARELCLTDRLTLKMHLLSDRMESSIRGLGFDDEFTSLLSAMLLGRKSGLSSQTRSLYQDVGASHVLALSGLHLSILIGAFLFILLRICVNRPWCIGLGSLSLVLIWGYAMLAGLTPSLVRASIMTSLFILSKMVGRGQEPLHTLGVAALVLLLVSPRSLYDVGFQLTFVAMLSLLHFGPLLQTLWTPRHRPVRWIYELVGTSVSVQLGTMPLVAYYFHQIPVMGLLFGVVFALAAGWIIWLTLSAIALQWIGSNILLLPLSYLLISQRWVMQHIVSIPGSIVHDLYPSRMTILSIYGIIILIYCLLLRRRSWIELAPYALALSILLFLIVVQLC